MRLPRMIACVSTALLALGAAEALAAGSTVRPGISAGQDLPDDPGLPDLPGDPDLPDDDPDLPDDPGLPDPDLPGDDPDGGGGGGGGDATPTPAPSPSVTPTPTPTLAPASYTRAVRARLSRRGVIAGRVASERKKCAAKVPVKVKRNGKLVRRGRTDAKGGLRMRMKRRRGRYAIVAPAYQLSDGTCLRAAGKALRRQDAG